jgi:Ca2+:H+ antiporter
MSNILKNEWTVIVAALIASILTAVLTLARANAVLVFLISVIALATLATVVGHATEQLGNYLGPGPTGVLQASVASMPELFVSFFALRAGLVTVVQSAIVGSILANTLLIMGLAFLFGGWKNGTQRFGSERPRAMAILMVLAVAALVMPTLVDTLHTPAEAHEEALSIASAVVLLGVFAASIPFSWKGGPIGETIPVEELEEKPWPMSRAAIVLALAGIITAFVSDWFVQALEPTIESWGISQAFAGLVIVAIAGNAVENVVGIRLAIKNKVDFAISVILNSSLQIALALTPILIILSYFFTSVALTLVLPPLLVVALALAALLSALIVYDGESNWLEGIALVGLYLMIAVSFWWG